MRRPVCGAYALEVVSEARVRRSADSPGGDGLAERAEARFGEGNQPGDRSAVSLHDERISAVPDAPKDVAEPPRQVSRCNPVLHIRKIHNTVKVVTWQVDAQRTAHLLLTGCDLTPDPMACIFTVKSKE